MKKKHLVAIIIIAVAIAMIVSAVGDAGTYVTFDEAKTLSAKGFKRSIHVVGELPKGSSGEVLGIEESPDKLSFKFLMIDEKGKEQQVLYADPMPTDFVRSEKVVIVGAYRGDRFVAEKILLKCPSKYQEDPEFIG